MKTYLIYNGFYSNLLRNEEIITAKSGADAAREVLRKMGFSNCKVRRSAGSNVKIKTTPIIIKDGQKYYDGPASWFAIIPPEVKP